MNLRLIGAPTLKDIDANMVDASSISQHSTLPGESIFNANCRSFWVRGERKSAADVILFCFSR
jgi:hypothetical protein